MPSPEPFRLFTRKLEELGLRDISRMLASLGDDWPRQTLLDLVEDYGLESEWEKARVLGD